VVGRNLARTVEARRGEAVLGRHGRDGFGPEENGPAVWVGMGLEALGMVRIGRVRQLWSGTAR